MCFLHRSSCSENTPTWDLHTFHNMKQFIARSQRMPPASVTHVSFHEQTTLPRKQACCCSPLGLQHPPTACHCCSPILSTITKECWSRMSLHPQRGVGELPLQGCRQSSRVYQALGKRAHFSVSSTVRKAVMLCSLPVLPSTGGWHIAGSSWSLPAWRAGWQANSAAGVPHS